ncbi:Crp/Fnr family transcriptional regulator [Paenibacillus sp. 1P07SE]|uniref:Crp/Fnr family transcriptional regulator n=1 Tax=Paenibacillus sp. 1P07SE TaxID=3132209 RepID=UPI0039A55A08
MNQEMLRERIPFFRELAPEVLAQVMPWMHERTLKKNAIVFIEEDVGDEIYFILSGSVHIYNFDGVKRVILAVLQDGDFFGEMALMKPGLLRSATAEAMSQVKLLALRRPDFEGLIEAHPRLALHMLNYTMERLRRANQQIYDLTFLNVRTRIIKRLLRMAGERGKPDASGTGSLIEVKLTHQQIADMVGSVRETVTKVLLELQEEGLIAIRNKMVHIPDPDRLEAKIEEVQ